MKVRVGDINVVNGSTWKDGKLEKSIQTQNYIVLPQQSSLEGANFGSPFLSQFTLSSLMEKRKSELPEGRILLEFHPESSLDILFYDSLFLDSESLPTNKSLSDLSIKKGSYIYMRSKKFGTRPSQICDLVNLKKDNEIFLHLKTSKVLIFVKPSLNVSKSKGPKGTIPVSIDSNQTIASLMRSVKESKQFSTPPLGDTFGKDIKVEYKYRFIFYSIYFFNFFFIYFNLLHFFFFYLYFNLFHFLISFFLIFLFYFYFN